MKKKSLKFNEYYRPIKFKDVIGQERTLKALDNAIKRDEVQYCYSFYGGPGKGKTSVARAFGNKLICLNLDDENEPCGSCEACIDYKNNPFSAGVIEIDGASNANINDIRDLRKALTYAPPYGRYVVILDEVQDIKGAGASALLKLLEEPPLDNIVFILLTTKYEAILDAIRSRCTSFCFDTISPKHIKSRLIHIALENNIQITEKALDLISEGVNECVRDAVKILQQVSLITDNNINEKDLIGFVKTESEYIKQLIDLIIKGDTTEIMSFINDNVFNVSSNDFDFISKRIREALFTKEKYIVSIKGHLINIANIFLTYKKNISLYPNTTMALEFASVESALYLNEHINNKKSLINAFIKKDIKKNNDILSVDKKELFLNMLYLASNDLETLFSNYDISLDGTGSILKFLVDTEEDKIKLRNILTSDIPQKIKPIANIEGFVVKVKSDN